MTPFDTLVSKAFRVAIAVSGGADSFALLHMAKDWADLTNKTIVALTVDHQLRANSAQEAEIVARWCQQKKIEHHILKWNGPKPSSALQDTARIARRRLLCDFCKTHNVPILLTGHQADDQAETIVMRLQRGSGLHGLTSIPEQAIDQATGVQIIRPLLHMRRAELRSYARKHNLPFIDDPSNDDANFERVRVRQALQNLPQLADGIGLTIQRLVRAERALRDIAHQWVLSHIQTVDDAQFIPKHLWLAQPDDIRLRTVSLCLDKADPTLDGVEALCIAMAQDEFAGQTLAGMWIKPKTLDKIQGFLLQKAPPRHG